MLKSRLLEQGDLLSNMKRSISSTALANRIFMMKAKKYTKALIWWNNKKY
jgi:hypothetical protein